MLLPFHSSSLLKAHKNGDYTFLLPRGSMAAADCYVWSLRKAPLEAYPIIGDPIIVIIMVTFITQAIFVMVFLTRVGKFRAVIL